MKYFAVIANVAAAGIWFLNWRTSDKKHCLAIAVFHLLLALFAFCALETGI